MSAAAHIPVLLDEVMTGLAIQPGETHVDGTFGAGGYSRAMLEFGARVYAFDRDPSAIREGVSLADESGGRLTLVPERFSRMRQALARHGVEAVDGVALDIGVSPCSSTRRARLLLPGRTARSTCAWAMTGRARPTFVNEADEAEIADVIFRYGEEPNPAASPGRSLPRARSSDRPACRRGSPRDRLASRNEEGSGNPHLSGNPIHLNENWTRWRVGWKRPSRCWPPAAGWRW
jgi:16S rRNA (cytosine1402-N4)-methyltransferase